MELRPPGCGHVLPVVEVSLRKPWEGRRHAGQEERDRQPAHALFPPNTSTCCRVNPGRGHLSSLPTPNKYLVDVPLLRLKRLPALLSARLPDLAGRAASSPLAASRGASGSLPPPPPPRPLGLVTGAMAGGAQRGCHRSPGPEQRGGRQRHRHGYTESEQEKERERERKRERGEREGGGREERKRRKGGGGGGMTHRMLL